MMQRPSRSCGAVRKAAGTPGLVPQPRLRFGLQVEFGQLAASGVDEPVIDLAQRQRGGLPEGLLFLLGGVGMADMIVEPALQSFRRIPRQVAATFGPWGRARRRGRRQRRALQRAPQSMPPVGDDPGSLARAWSSPGRRPPLPAARRMHGRTIPSRGLDGTAGGGGRTGPGRVARRVQEVTDRREPRPVPPPLWAGGSILELVESVDRRQHRTEPIRIGLVGRGAVRPMTGPPVRGSGRVRDRAVLIVPAGRRRDSRQPHRRQLRHRLRPTGGSDVVAVHHRGRTMKFVNLPGELRAAIRRGQPSSCRGRS